MVIVRLIGGLANQMFPYAAGRRLAHSLGAELKLDISGFADYEKKRHLVPRAYGLGAFNILEEFASADEVASLREGQPNFLERITGRRPKPPASYVKERHYHFDPMIMSLRGDVYLDGNWNSPRYFKDIPELIRDDFSFKHEPLGRNAEVLDKIHSVNSVSLHIRRGDYVSNPKVNSVHGTCDIRYYQNCSAYIAERVAQPHFFIFSDEPEWAAENLNLKFPFTLVDHNGIDCGHEDMRLMSACRHNIIANSGFSWWAAWLNTFSDKIIIAPKRWFNVQKYDTSTLIPDGWVRL